MVHARGYRCERRCSRRRSSRGGCREERGPGRFAFAAKQHADVNAVDLDGTTALIYAAHQNDLDGVKLLLAAGANAKAANRYGITALAESCNVGNGPMIEALVNAGADANAPIGEGETPLMTASEPARWPVSRRCWPTART